jgi:hypothetical protein
MDITACYHTTYFHVFFFLTNFRFCKLWYEWECPPLCAAYIILEDILASGTLYFVHILKLDISGVRNLLLSAPFYEVFLMI